MSTSLIINLAVELFVECDIASRRNVLIKQYVTNSDWKTSPIRSKLISMHPENLLKS